MRLFAKLFAAFILSYGANAAAQSVSFTDFKLKNIDTINLKPKANEYKNPILPGYYPDPSIVRVKDDYYLINSSFAHFPGIPIFHSKDLVNWTQIANAIDRKGMLNFDGLDISRGVFAPDISYRDGLFYIINTCVDCNGNFIITSKDPKGPWSQPKFLPFGGIDPSIFNDEDGRSYVVYNEAPIGKPLYDGHRAIWIWEINLTKLEMIGKPKLIVNGGVDISKKPVWIEGPHIYKRNGAYYLIAAEGGTSVNHSQVVLKSENVMGDYIPYKNNPILTQRDLDPNRKNPITSAGHAKFVTTQNGETWAVFLATEPYRDNFYNTGRQTFLLPVKFENDWPIILDAGKEIPRIVSKPNLKPQNPLKSNPMLEYLGIRGDYNDSFKFDKNKIIALPNTAQLGDVKANPSFIGLRQKQMNADASSILNMNNLENGAEAGLVAFQNDNFYFFCGIERRDNNYFITTKYRNGAKSPTNGRKINSAIIHESANKSLNMKLRLELKTDKLSCKYGENEEILLQDFDATFLSTEKAGGFVGSIIGVYSKY